MRLVFPFDSFISHNVSQNNHSFSRLRRYTRGGKGNRGQQNRGDALSRARSPVLFIKKEASSIPGIAFQPSKQFVVLFQQIVDPIL